MSNPISIDGDAMKAVVAKAILEGVSEEDKNLLIEQALQYLITAPKSTGYGNDPKSPLQVAFNDAVTSACREVVKEMVLEGELRERIKILVNRKVGEVLEEDSVLASGLGFAIGEYIGDSLRKVSSR